MLTRGLPVPPGFTITTDAYRAALGGEVLAAIEEALQAETGLTERAAGAQRVIENSRTNPGLVDEIRRAYDALCRRADTEDVPVAVRSSAAAEDLAGASFAGEYETYLWVRGGDEVAAAVARCWASLFSERALSYREHEQIEMPAAMAVVVQEMVPARSAGVLFTLNPENGDRSKIAVESTWGLGEALVGGEVNPDYFLLDKITGEIVRRRIERKELEVVPDEATGSGVTRRPIPPPRCDEPSIVEDELEQLRQLGRTAESSLGAPVDMEWAIAGDRVVVLQVRAETAWSKKREKSAMKEASAVDYVISGLLRGND
jgi:pyruvate, water dikinase